MAMISSFSIIFVISNFSNNLFHQCNMLLHLDYMDTDRFTVYIKTDDIYKDIAEDKMLKRGLTPPFMN